MNYDAQNSDLITMFPEEKPVTLNYATIRDAVLRLIVDRDNCIKKATLLEDAYNAVVNSLKKHTVPTDKTEDEVNHPTHYNTGKYEVIDVIEDWKLDFCLGNAVKYIARCERKNPGKAKIDLSKAIWYIERYIKTREKNI